VQAQPQAEPPRPWLGEYGDLPHSILPRHSTALEVIRAGVAEVADRPFVRYRRHTLSALDVDAASDALAVELLERGIASGDRIVLRLQTMPTAMLGLVAAWKLGAIPVWANPMYRASELGHIVRDSGARALLTLDDEREEVVTPAIEGSAVAVVITTDADDHAGSGELAVAIERRLGERPPAFSASPDDVASLVYTSGTTGLPKGAMSLHRNIVFAVDAWREWVGLDAGDRLFAAAPVFHVTGLVTGLILPFGLAASVTMPYRFDAGEAIDAIDEQQLTFTVTAITAFTAMMNHPSFSREKLQSLTKTYSGGAPIAPATAERWHAATGAVIRNCYGMTETSTLAICTPPAATPRVDEASGALSVGVPVSSTTAEIVDASGRPLAPGEIGELLVTGPQVTAGYWNRPDETAAAFDGARLKTGDVGFMDDDGWFYVVDRSKDVIVASGFKVWPREVEDVLVRHEAVAEAAVVGIPDDYRGETPKAFVALRPSTTVDADELSEFCRRHLAAYKVPRHFEFVDELPKSASGKILRRELRSA
jgi:long-chain acyl-CoA synthetase